MKQIVLHWKDGQNRRHSLEFNKKYFKNYMTEIAEDLFLDKVFDVYYTIENITHKLDYYNVDLNDNK